MKVISCAAALTAICCASVSAQENARERSHSSICPSTPDPLSGTTLQAQVVDSGLSLLTKDEFETSDQFKVRMGRAVKAVFPSLMISVAIHVPSHKISYDADTQRLTFELTRSDYLIRSSNLAVTEVASSSLDKGYYDAQNRFGATVEVKREDVTELVFAWGASSRRMSKGVLVVPPAEARQIKEFAELVLAVHLVDPYFEKRSGSTPPTMDFPSHTEAISTALYVKPTCMYLRNAKDKPYALTVAD